MDSKDTDRLRRRILAAAGVAFLGYQAGEVGAAPPPAEERPQNLVSVFEFMTPEQIADVKAYAYTRDVAAAIEKAFATVKARGGGVVWAPAGGYLLGTSSADPDAHYSYITARDGVSFMGAGKDVTILKVKGGENARFKGTTGPNVIGTKQATPLKNCIFAGFTVDWNGANNLLKKGDMARNNASISSFNGGINIVCMDVKTVNNPGSQCILFPAASPQGQGNIHLLRCDAYNCGSGLPGNYNEDHSSFYCNGNSLRYENLRGDAQEMVYGALYELHGSDAQAHGCWSNNYSLGFWIASNYEPIGNIKVTNGVHTNVHAAFSISAQKYAVDDVEIASCDFMQAKGLSRTQAPYFVNGSTIESCNSLSIHHCRFRGQGYPSMRFLLSYKIADLRFESNDVAGFGAYGILGMALDIGGGRFARLLSIIDNTFTDVANAVYCNVPTLSCDTVDIRGNVFRRSKPDKAPAVTFSARSSQGVIGPNIYSSHYAVRFFGTPNGALPNGVPLSWNPALTGSQKPGTPTLGFMQASYTVTEGRVFFELRLAWSAHNGAGQMQISLPVPPGGPSSTTPVLTVYEGMGGEADRLVQAMIEKSAEQIRFFVMNRMGEKTAYPLPASGHVYLSGSYIHV